MQIKQRIEQQHRASEVITINELMTTTVTENTARSVLVGMDANVATSRAAASSMEATCRCPAMVVDRSMISLSLSLTH
jgi:hypothetical protein